MKDADRQTAADEFVRNAQVRRELGGISESTQYEWLAAGILPPLDRLSTRVVGYWRSRLETIKADRAAGNLPRVDREAVRRQRREARAAQAAAQ
jgi:predicted DNA-binding transcriptional regulator AlpA